MSTQELAAHKAEIAAHEATSIPTIKVRANDTDFGVDFSYYKPHEGIWEELEVGGFLGRDDLQLTREYEYITLDGSGDAHLEVEGDAYAVVIRDGSGDGNAEYRGTGGGHAKRWGTGAGKAWPFIPQ